jgi:hypothetical protein
VSKFLVTIEGGDLLQRLAGFVGESDSLFHNVQQTVADMALGAQMQWVGYAMGQPLPDGKVIGSRSGAYAKSIQSHQISPFEWEIFSDSPYASIIEEGAPERDLKKMLTTSNKVRRTKDGRKYLIIPFRWGTTDTSTFGGNVIPDSLHKAMTQKERINGKMVQKFRPSYVTGVRFEPSVQDGGGPDVRRSVYDWGNRVTKSMLTGTKNASRMMGMVNMREKGGTGNKSSQYLTFRIMMEGSDGWIAPARQGKWPAKHTEQSLSETMPDAIQRAANEDLSVFRGS